MCWGPPSLAPGAARFVVGQDGVALGVAVSGVGGEARRDRAFEVVEGLLAAPGDLHGPSFDRARARSPASLLVARIPSLSSGQHRSVDLGLPRPPCHLFRRASPPTYAESSGPNRPRRRSNSERSPDAASEERASSPEQRRRRPLRESAPTTQPRRSATSKQDAAAAGRPGFAPRSGAAVARVRIRQASPGPQLRRAQFSQS